MTLYFHDRNEAGRLLAGKLLSFRRDPEAVVYALPRGGVITGYEVAKMLEVPLDIVIVRKIGYPGFPECAVGAVTEKGELLYEGDETVDESWLGAVAGERREILRRRKAYLGGRMSIPASGKTAIVVDDGIATGLTLRAALISLREQKPKKLIVAVPVAPHSTVKKLKREADKVVVLEDTEPYLGSVSAYYGEFFEVSDQEVVRCLELSREPLQLR